MNNFPAYLQDLVKTCGNHHSTLWPTSDKARKAKCPKCSGAQAKEPTPRSYDPDPWATGYGEQRARESRRRGIEKSARQRRVS